MIVRSRARPYGAAASPEVAPTAAATEAGLGDVEVHPVVRTGDALKIIDALVAGGGVVNGDALRPGVHRSGGPAGGTRAVGDRE